MNVLHYQYQCRSHGFYIQSISPICPWKVPLAVSMCELVSPLQISPPQCPATAHKPEVLVCTIALWLLFYLLPFSVGISDSKGNILDWRSRSVVGLFGIWGTTAWSGPPSPTRYTSSEGTLINWWTELNTKNSTKRQQSCRLVEFLVFNSAFGRHSN